MTTYRITPTNRRYVMVANMLQPLSHHDPDDKSKTSLSTFRRVKKSLPLSGVRDLPDVGTINAVAAQFQIPESAVEFMSDLDVIQYLAVALLYTFCMKHGRGEGTGLFAGKERYQMLEGRARQAAIRCSRLGSWYSLLCKDLQVPDTGYEEAVMRTLALPPAVGTLILREMVENIRYLIMLARLFSDEAKGTLKSEGELVSAPALPLHTRTAGSAIVDVPSYSPNSARHEFVREPGALHLLFRLGLRYEDLRPGVAAMLYNGGNLSEASPGNVYTLQRKVRDSYPFLGLVGGSTNAFLLGASALEVGAWIVCRENDRELAQLGLSSDVSVFDLLDTQTMTRHNGGGMVDVSPMPFSFETLATGTQIALTFTLRPYASTLEAGALAAALHTFESADSTIAGQSARGSGQVALEYLQIPDDAAECENAYEEYIQVNAQAIADGLRTGMLTCEGKVPLCS